MDYQEIFAAAQRSEADGDLSGAFQLYDQVYEAIIKEAGEAAKQADGALANGPAAVLTEAFFQAANQYMLDHPQTRQALYHMGRILVAQAEPDKAKPLLRRALELTPADQTYPELNDLLASLNQ